MIMHPAGGQRRANPLSQHVWHQLSICGSTNPDWSASVSTKRTYHPLYACGNDRLGERRLDQPRITPPLPDERRLTIGCKFFDTGVEDSPQGATRSIGTNDSHTES